MPSSSNPRPLLSSNNKGHQAPARHNQPLGMRSTYADVGITGQMRHALGRTSDGLRSHAEGSSYGTRAPTAIHDHFRHVSRRWQTGLMDHQQAREHTSVVIRPYEHSDAAETLAVFISAVTETASADYTAEQVQAWAQPERRDVGTWHAAMLARNSIVATIGGELAVLTTDVGNRFVLDMRKTSEWSGAV